jgi:hypothetical protein
LAAAVLPAKYVKISTTDALGVKMRTRQKIPALFLFALKKRIFEIASIAMNIPAT